MGSGGVAIAALPTVICFKVTFSDGLGGGVGTNQIISCTANRMFTDSRLYEFGTGSPLHFPASRAASLMVESGDSGPRFSISE